MAYTKPEITVSYNCAVVAGQRLEKPAHIGAMEWMRFWEEAQMLDTEDDPDGKIKSLESEIESLKSELNEANQEIASLRNQLNDEF